MVHMNFADSYRDTFATVGVHLRDEDGCPATDIEQAERRLGIKIPISLREYYLLSGREKRINQFYDRLRSPEKWEIDSVHWDIDSDQVVFMEENQWVAYWGVASVQEGKADDAVSVGFNIRKKGIQWRPEHDSCVTFLNVMILWHASFGGAVKNAAVGFVEEAPARKTLDDGWELVGEVRKMRAYKRAGQAVCLVKWEDIMQKMRKLPPWRLHAAAASAEALEETKTALTAQWERWGGDTRPTV
jgi:hypothetical protein